MHNFHTKVGVANNQLRIGSRLCKIIHKRSSFDSLSLQPYISYSKEVPPCADFFFFFDELYLFHYMYFFFFFHVLHAKSLRRGNPPTLPVCTLGPCLKCRFEVEKINIIYHYAPHIPTENWESGQGYSSGHITLSLLICAAIAVHLKCDKKATVLQVHCVALSCPFF